MIYVYGYVWNHMIKITKYQLTQKFPYTLITFFLPLPNFSFISSLPTIPGQSQIGLLVTKINLHFLPICIQGLINYVLFCVCLLSLRILILGTHKCYWICWYSLLFIDKLYSVVWLYCSFVYSLTCWWIFGLFVVWGY